MPVSRRKPSARLLRNDLRLNPFKTLTLLASSAALFGLCQAESSCTAPSGTNFNNFPKFWCSLKANITIGSGCISNVQETITLPWASGNVIRAIPHQEDQTITDILAYQADDGRQKLLHKTKEQTSTSTSTVLKFRVQSSKDPMSMILRYSVTPGVLKFDKCDITAFPSASPPASASMMMAKWAVGGLSVQKVNSLEVTFILANSAKTLLDSPIKQPEEFSGITTTTSTDATSGVASVTHTGDLQDNNPGAFLFYVRFGLVSGWALCPESRQCAVETLQLDEVLETPMRRGLVIGLAVGGAVLLVGVCVVLGLLLCRKRPAVGAMSPAGGAGLPDSLRHFAYDTDESSPKPKSAKWQEWTEASGQSWKTRGQEGEINAIDLSPKHRHVAGRDS